MKRVSVQVSFPYRSRRRKAILALVLGVFAVAFSATVFATGRIPNLAAFLDPTGWVQTFTTQGTVNPGNPFFQDLGTNGRTCATCHEPSDAWSVTPPHIQERFQATGGLDPIFRPVDGANCPSADTSTVAERHAAYSMLLNKGVFRISLPVPGNADFQVTSVNDPNGCPETTSNELALFRRPPPGTNLPFLTAVMWDGRESPAGRTLVDNLTSQALDATMGHAQADHPPTTAQLAAIVQLEISTFTTQAFDTAAGNLHSEGARGGPVPLSQQKFHLGINDPLGANAADFNPNVFTLFTSWKNSASPARASVARGQALFNTLPLTISGVAGLNNLPGVPQSFAGTCTTCHNTPNVGNHSVPLAINIGVSDYPARPGLDGTGLPVYTIQCIASGETVETTDPGRALITGKCADVGKFKGPILRGLAGRAPYFHNGSAASLMDVLDFYEQRFNAPMTEQQKQDLVAFLRSL